MTISIQPLNSFGQPTDKVFTSDFVTFLDHNDGFSLAEAARIWEVLNMGSGYLIGGGAMGEYRLSKAKEEV